MLNFKMNELKKLLQYIMKLNKKNNKRDFWSMVSTVQRRRSSTNVSIFRRLSEIENTFLDN
jgi:hypothetical protein